MEKRASREAASLRTVFDPEDVSREFQQRSVSDILLQTLHGGLRLRPGYMVRHRRRLVFATKTMRGFYACESLIVSADRTRYESYVLALNESFGDEYLRHLMAWLAADGVAVPVEEQDASALVPSLRKEKV